MFQALESEHLRSKTQKGGLISPHNYESPEISHRNYSPQKFTVTSSHKTLKLSLDDPER